jgi:hypothetical protein
MDDAQKAAFVMSQVVCAQAEIAGMQAENTTRMTAGEPLRWGLQDFQNVPSKYGLWHNDVISYFTGR